MGGRVSLLVLVAILAPAAARADDVEARIIGEGVVMSQTMNGWTRVCVAPCDVALERGAVYKITGDSLRESKPFAFVPAHDRVVMRIDAARRAPWLAGLVVGILGTTLATAGGVLTAFASISENGLGGASNSPGGMAAGGVLIGVGVVTAIVAYAFAVANTRTAVHLAVRP